MTISKYMTMALLLSAILISKTSQEVRKLNYTFVYFVHPCVSSRTRWNATKEDSSAVDRHVDVNGYACAHIAYMRIFGCSRNLETRKINIHRSRKVLSVQRERLTSKFCAHPRHIQKTENFIVTKSMIPQHCK